LDLICLISVRSCKHGQSCCCADRSAMIDREELRCTCSDLGIELRSGDREQPLPSKRPWPVCIYIAADRTCPLHFLAAVAPRGRAVAAVKEEFVKC
jgi:hypothetical protein